MSSNTFFPTTEAAQAQWLANYSVKISLHALACGISAEELAGTLLDLRYWIWLIQECHPAAKTYLKRLTAVKSAMITGSSTDTIAHLQPPDFSNAPPAPAPGMQRRLFSQVVRMKASAGYSESIGKDLGIIAIADTVEHPVPEFFVTVELGPDGPRVRIDFKKYRHDGIWIESRINGGDWEFLAVDTVKPYLDERPLAAGNTHETREYRLRWWDKSQPHGEWTAIQRAVLGV
ncbi:hypothetical protein [uncultured Thiodictyon sp.]|uniref:hypothetical protein n=1 Tax=uncultured Thiodictyon sp. TaxID=1846217 RepID=UPI0025CDD544|nr:hypothetical protein [uncultured Thiodictyon sp.]